MSAIKFLVILLIVTSNTAHAGEKEVMKSNCIDKWHDDESMQAYCFNDQMAGYKYATRMKTITKDTIFKKVIKRCDKRWYPDFEMVGQCIKDQQNSIKKMEYFKSKNDKNTNKAIGICKKYRYDFEMRVYCVREKIEQYQKWDRKKR